MDDDVTHSIPALFNWVKWNTLAEKVHCRVHWRHSCLMNIIFVGPHAWQRTHYFCGLQSKSLKIMRGKIWFCCFKISSVATRNIKGMFAGGGVVSRAHRDLGSGPSKSWELWFTSEAPVLWKAKTGRSQAFNWLSHLGNLLIHPETLSQNLRWGATGKSNVDLRTCVPVHTHICTTHRDILKSIDLHFLIYLFVKY